MVRLAAGWRAPDRRGSCAGCERRVSATAGTIFQGTRTPLTVWFFAAWHLSSGKGGIGAANAPAFKGIKWQHGNGSFEGIVNTVVTGVAATEIKDPTHKFPMGARGGRTPLTDDQIKAVSAYVFTISR